MFKHSIFSFQVGDGRFSEPTLKKRFYGEYKNTLFLCKQVIGEHSKLGASQKATVCVPPSKGSEGKKKKEGLQVQITITTMLQKPTP